jgi:hypothetical protein
VGVGVGGGGMMRTCTSATARCAVSSVHQLSALGASTTPTSEARSSPRSPSTAPSPRTQLTPSWDTATPVSAEGANNQEEEQVKIRSKLGQNVILTKGFDCRIFCCCCAFQAVSAAQLSPTLPLAAATPSNPGIGAALPEYHKHQRCSLSPI